MTLLLTLATVILCLTPAKSSPGAFSHTDAPPKCPPGSDCTFVHYWGEVSNHFCQDSIIQPNAMEICDWIREHCKLDDGGDIIITPVVPVPEPDPDPEVPDPEVPDPEVPEPPVPDPPPPDPVPDPVPEPVITCKKNPRCTKLGRATLLAQPCNRCGTCFSNTNDVCPSDPRDPRLISISGDNVDVNDQEASCLCKCKKEPTCQDPQIFFQTTCSCGCDNEATKQNECLLAQHHSWDAATCACTCDGTFDPLTHVQSVFPTCALTCSAQVIADCGKKIPFDDCSGCGECDATLPKCPGNTIRQDDCECACPKDATTSQTAQETCRAKHATLDAVTCGCVCSNACSNPQHAHTSPEGDCDVCSCPLTKQSVCDVSGTLQSSFSQDTCLWECDSTVSCSGQQQNVPLVEGAGATCQCECACPSDSRNAVVKDNQIFNEETCQVDCKPCGNKMVADPETCQCSCDTHANSCENDLQALLPVLNTDACGCQCSETIVQFVKTNQLKYVLDVHTCEKSCNIATPCKYSAMERVLDKNCECQCTAKAEVACAHAGGNWDKTTCSCPTCQKSTRVDWQLKPSATVATDCEMECKPKNDCTLPLGTLDEFCACQCTETSLNKCDGKGAPTPPACDTCGACLNAPECGEREQLNQQTCKCECKDATTLNCPQGNTGVDGQCGCLCPPPAESFMEIRNPNTSCNLDCQFKESCRAVSGIGGTITFPSKESQCECHCQDRMCADLFKSKNVWRSETDPSQGCHCVCPTEPETCEEGYDWDAEECRCTCKPDSCHCGTRKNDYDEYCKKVGMVATDHCTCACTDEWKQACSAQSDVPGLVVAAVLTAPNGAFSCSCKCHNWQQTCPGSQQILTDYNGKLPYSKEDAIDGQKKHVNHLEFPPDACKCACPESTFMDIFSAGRTSKGSKMIARDTTCSITRCPVALVHHYRNLPLANPLQIFNGHYTVCAPQCVEHECPTGQDRTAFPDCRCDCPSTSPPCDSRSFQLASDCSKCVCKETCAYSDMIQDEHTCGCTCKTPAGGCPYGKSIHLTASGCSRTCLCDKSASACRALQNTVVNPNSCQCNLCHPDLPRTTPDGQRLYFEEGRGCSYYCDQASSKANQCIRNHEIFSELQQRDGSFTCGCQCDPSKTCHVWNDAATNKRFLINRKRDGQCQCSCRLDMLEQLIAEGCPNKKQRVNRGDCTCSCPNIAELEQKCYKTGKDVDEKNCGCTCRNQCPGKQMLLDERDCFSCSCPASTMSKYTMNHPNARLINSQLTARPSFYQPLDEQCNWGCSIYQENLCRQEGMLTEVFPSCQCQRRVPVPKPKLRKPVNGDSTPSYMRSTANSRANRVDGFRGDHTSRAWGAVEPGPNGRYSSFLETKSPHSLEVDAGFN